MTSAVTSPLRLEPILVPKPWGGRRLELFGKRLPDDGHYGESWDVADLPPERVSTGVGSRSEIVGGRWAGSTLREVIAEVGPGLLGSARPTPSGDFPLLYKLLDAREHLSVQVHPDDDYASHNPEVSVKTESWYIVDADPGAVIYKDVHHGVTRDDVARTAGTPDLVALLQPVPAEPGSFHHLPAGLIHALGAGVLVAEPQTPSDTTFRLYDWTAEYARDPRRLHIEEAVAALRIDPEGAFALPGADSPGSRRLIHTKAYWIVEHASVSTSEPLGDANELRIVAVLEGDAALSLGNDVIPLSPGDTVVVPAAVTPDTLIATTMATWLEIGIAGEPTV